MSESKHTPGPWIVRQFPTGAGARAKDYVMDSIPDDNGRVIANVIAAPTLCPRWQANARLIAAAPDLLDALESMVDMFERHIDGRPGPDDAAQRWDVARDAIAKAKGE